MGVKLELTSKEIQSFDALKKETAVIAMACDKLNVTDDTSLAIATQNLSKANEYIKNIEKLRKELKDPYFQVGKKIDALADAMSSPLEKTLSSGKNKILAYNTWKKSEADKEEKRIQGVKNKINTYAAEALGKMRNCATDEELIVIHNTYIKNFPIDTEWSEFAPEAHLMRTQLRDFASARRIEIRTPTEADTQTAEVITEQIAETVKEVGAVQIEEAKFTTTTQFRGTWKEEVIDITKMPLAWLMPDEKKLKAFSKENRDKIVDGEVINGVKFFVDKTVQIK